MHVHKEMNIKNFMFQKSPSHPTFPVSTDKLLLFSLTSLPFKK